ERSEAFSKKRQSHFFDSLSEAPAGNCRGLVYSYAAQHAAGVRFLVICGVLRKKSVKEFTFVDSRFHRLYNII
ncbi:MAG: hypothetical protein Q4C32_06730, partial [Eubacteriales bacterium]|nr:hypothetical protein [Eubacteriales bacterium]